MFLAAMAPMVYPGVAGGGEAGRVFSASWLVSVLLQAWVMVWTCWGRWATAKLGFELLCMCQWFG